MACRNSSCSGVNRASIVHPLDQAALHRHRKRRRLHHALLARIDLDLEVAELLPLGVELGRINGPELHRAVVRVAHHASRAGNHVGRQQIELGRVEEVNEALFVVVRVHAQAPQRRADLVVWHGGLDLDGLGACHGLGHLVARGLATLCHGARAHRLGLLG